jgi:hypothetical protein
MPDLTAAGLMDPSTAMALRSTMLGGFDQNNPQLQQQLLFMMNQYMQSMQSLLSQSYQNVNVNAASSQSGTNPAQPSLTPLQPGATNLQPGINLQSGFNHLLQPGVNPQQPGVNPMLQPGLNIPQPGANQFQPGINPVQLGAVPLQLEINLLESCTNPLQPELVAPASGLYSATFGRGLSAPSQGLGSSIGMGVNPSYTGNLLSNSPDPQSLQGRGRSMSNIMSPPGGLQKKQ